MDSNELIIKLSNELEDAKDPMPILKELLGFLNSDNQAFIEKTQSILLSYFDSVRLSAPHKAMGQLIKALRAECANNTPAAEFLDTAFKAYELILEEAYKKIIRTMSGSYKTDGSVMCCPKCSSTNVYEGENSAYEFTHMICKDCGHSGMPDDYELEEWYR